MRLALLLLSAGWIVAGSAGAQAPAPSLREIGKVTHPPIAEMSGIVRSRTYPDVWWVHNDSGDTPRLFAIDGAGKALLPTWQAARWFVDRPVPGRNAWPGVTVHLAAHIDWEDIALHDGRLYVADTGNNGNARRDLGIYVLAEPNPRATAECRALTWWPVRYPEQTRFPARAWHFDCESLFVDRGTPYLITKHRVAGQINQLERGANLYRLDTRHTDRANVLVRVDRHARLPAPTGADLSPDGTHLAVLTMFGIWVFSRPAQGDRWLSSAARVLPLKPAVTRQTEGICWDDDRTLRVTNEQRRVFVVPLSAFPPASTED